VLASRLAWSTTGLPPATPYRTDVSPLRAAAATDDATAAGGVDSVWSLLQVGSARCSFMLEIPKRSKK
jgi:hypothetical protein